MSEELVLSGIKEINQGGSSCHSRVPQPLSRFPVQTNWYGLTSRCLKSVPLLTRSTWGVGCSETIPCFSWCLSIWFPGCTSEGHHCLGILGISPEPGSSAFELSLWRQIKNTSWVTVAMPLLPALQSLWQTAMGFPWAQCKQTHLAKCLMALWARKKDFFLLKEEEPPCAKGLLLQGWCLPSL